MQATALVREIATRGSALLAVPTVLCPSASTLAALLIFAAASITRQARFLPLDPATPQGSGFSSVLPTRQEDLHLFL